MTPHPGADPHPPRGDPAAAVLAHLLPHLATIGITRLADQTGLDTVGWPVVAAIRPNSRSLATHQGKGATRAAAKVSAIMEAAECHLAEACALPLRLATAAELPGAVPPETLPATRPLPPDRRILWAPGTCLMSGQAAWVPHELVHADFTAPQPAGSFHFPATTNGLGAGLDPDHARCHAILELLERDAIATWRAQGGPGSSAGRRIDLAAVTHPACLPLLRRLRALSIAAAAWWVDAGSGLPTIQALLVPPDGGLAGIEPELGAACHPDPGQALLRALAEAAQARVTRIAGARDDYDPASYAATARAERLAQARRWLRPSLRETALLPGPAGPPTLPDLLAALHRRGCTSALWVDLAQPGLPITCGRAVIPGLAAPFGTAAAP